MYMNENHYSSSSFNGKIDESVLRVYHQQDQMYQLMSDDFIDGEERKHLQLQSEIRKCNDCCRFYCIWSGFFCPYQSLIVIYGQGY